MDGNCRLSSMHSKQAVPDGYYKRSSARFMLLQNACASVLFRVQGWALAPHFCTAGNRATNAAVHVLHPRLRPGWSMGLQADLGGFALVQQAQPLQLHVWVVTQNFAEGSIGQISYIGSLPHNLLQAFC